MENEEKTLNLEEEIKNEEVEEEVVEEKPDLSEELKKARDESAKWRRLAEKKAKPSEAPPLAPNALSADDVDVKILQSQGADEATIEYLKKIAKVNGTSVLAAQSDDLFVAFKEKKEREDKAQKASIGASQGSGSSQKGKTVSTPGLSAEEHKELWKTANER